jgi:hypothetical protein
MPKPGWLIEAEERKRVEEKDTCLTCEHIGRFIRRTRRANGERLDVFECAIHPGCYNTIRSIKCEDYSPR